MTAALGHTLAARAADPARFAIAGLAPRLAVQPASFDEAAGIVRECAQRALALVPWGGGTALALESAPPPRYDVALDTGLLRAVRVYEPDDYTITAGCGIPMAALRERLEACGQELPLECAAPASATLGGALACNASGARRLALGGARDRILGARFATGDGVLAQTGGRVVKNVAGHAVHRLLVGSRGGLAVLLEASLKLLPAPPARVATLHGLDAAALADPARWQGLSRREPAALTVLSREVARAPLDADADFAVVAIFEGDPAWTEDGRALVSARLGAPVREWRGTEVPAVAQALVDAAEHPGPRLTLTGAHNSPALPGAIFADSAEGPLLFHAPAGRLHVWPAPDEAPRRAAALAAQGFALLGARACEPDAPPPPRAERALRARLAAALDPAGVFAYGPRWREGR